MKIDTKENVQNGEEAEVSLIWMLRLRSQFSNALRAIPSLIGQMPI